MVTSIADGGRRRRMAYTEEQRSFAIAAVVEGLRNGIPLTVICSDEGMPCDRTIRDWADADPALASAIARAREAGFDAIAMDALNIADETSNDTIMTENGERANAEWISRSKLRVETRLKLLAKWDPKRYGDKLAIGGADDLPPVQSAVNVSGLSEAALRELAALEVPGE